MFAEYDIIIVGGGHAGCEAAHAAAKMGSSVLLVTMNMNTIAQMSCNPAIGGVAKGQIVREIDALGGLTGIIADRSMLQFRMLNKSKGPAMWSPRSQNDRMQFAAEWRTALENTVNVDFWQEMVTNILVENGRAAGVVTALGIEIKSKAVILTNGTFLNGLIHIGEKNFGGGRSAERAAKGITEQLVSLGFESGRMKTGTPPRVDGRSLDYEKMEEQKGDENPGKFSYSDTRPLTNQRSCYITYTNPEVHGLLETGFDRSPMFNGRIQGVGPRYCPSIEDKINRFSERDRHQIFVEPEGWNTVEIYVNGFSTSLPEDVQYKALRKIAGFEHAKMFRPGYAIEYDYFPPTQLQLTLETQLVENLYFAGQINGTTGYEEAACQGLMAGINAHRKSKSLKEVVLSRSEAYIGVLIDDLINKGTEEPYRMFTSRAEFRILLRQDNADLRLTKKGYELGLADDQRYHTMTNKQQRIKDFLKVLDEERVDTSINEQLKEIKSAPINQRIPLVQLLKRPEINVHDLLRLSHHLKPYSTRFDTTVQEEAEIQVKYDTYISKEKQLAQKMASLDNLVIKDDFNYDEISSLSSEGREKLKRIKPGTIGQASRISGVSPSDISIIMIHMGR